MALLRPAFWKSVLRISVTVSLVVLGASAVFCQCTSVHSPKPENTIGQTADPVMATRLRSHVDMLATACFPRSFRDVKNQEIVKDYIGNELKKAGCKVSRQNVPAGRVTYENIIGLIPGKKPGKIIIGAHYDSCDETPGADDNASGIAGLLELARLLTRSPLEHTVELVAYCNEEPPHFATPDMGSVHHARLVQSRKDDVTAMICLEMIGYYSDKPDSQTYPIPALKLTLPSTGNFIGVVGNRDSVSLSKTIAEAMGKVSSLPVARANFPASLGMSLDFSDHRSYWELGYPAVMITDTAFYRNPNYHKAGDRPDTLDYKRMSDVVKSLYQAVLVLDQEQ